MPSRPPPTRLRPSAKAVICQDGAVLLTRNDSGNGTGAWFIFPGGGQEPGESLPEAVRREVEEETGLHVAVHELLWVREYIPSNHEWSYDVDHEEHQLEMMFRCTVIGGELRNGDGADEHQVGVEWVDADDLGAMRIYPGVALPQLMQLLRDGQPTTAGTVYLGDAD